MKKVLWMAALAGLLVACSKQEDMSSPPATGSTTTNSATSTNK